MKRFLTLVSDALRRGLRRWDPVVCRHGVVLDWGDYGDAFDVPSHCRTCEYEEWTKGGQQ